MSLTPVGDWIRKTWPHNPGATHYLGPGDDPGCAAGGHARCTYEAGWREALLPLAAEFGRQAKETHREARAHSARGDEDAEFMAAGASDAWRAAASRARGRARAGTKGDSAAQPVSPDTGEAQGRTEPLSASLPPCPTSCDGDCELNPDGCHESHQVPWKRSHNPGFQCLEVRRAIAAAVAAERERIAKLAETHWAHYWKQCMSSDDPPQSYSAEFPFEDLIREAGDG